MLKDRRILITGASGYLGSWLAEYAWQEEAKVRILLRRIPPHVAQWCSKFEVTLGDIQDRTSLRNICRGCEIVWHAASANETVCADSFEEAVSVNVSGTANLIELAVHEHVKVFLKLSTFHVYGYGDSGRITEDLTPSPVSVYGLSNLMGDLLGLFYRKAKGLSVIIPRISNGYGAPLFKEVNRWTLVINDLCKGAFEKKEIILKGSGLQHRDFVSIRDVFTALSLLSISPGEHAVYNVGGGRSRSLIEVAHLVKERYSKRYGIDIPIITMSPGLGEKAQELHFDISRLQALGYRPQDALKEEIDKIFDLLERSS